MNFQRLFNYIICFCFGYLLSYILTKIEPKVVDVHNESISKDSIIRDSIYIIKDSIIKQIEFVEKEYDKNVKVVVNADDSTQYKLFSDYIEHYNRTNKDSQLNICGTPEVSETDSFITNSNK